MKKLLLVALAALSLSGCLYIPAGHHGHYDGRYGNYSRGYGG